MKLQKLTENYSDYSLCSEQSGFSSAEENKNWMRSPKQ